MIEALTKDVDSPEQLKDRAENFEHSNVKVCQESITAKLSLVPGGCWDTEEIELTDEGTVRYPSLDQLGTATRHSKQFE
ncbi:MAG: hypothetical protein GY854_03780 [Deltaproteobacteria bacterium]|nr:hypothetical protein [Deltaproteobacteria bacterium]